MMTEVPIGLFRVDAGPNKISRANAGGPGQLPI